MKKGRIIAGLIVNLLIIGAACFGVLNLMFGFAFGTTPAADLLKVFESYAVDATVLMAVAALIAFIADIAMLAGKKPSRFVAVFKLIAVTATIVASAVVGGYLIPFAGKMDVKVLTDYSVWLWIYIVTPVLGIVSLIVENKPRLGAGWAWLGVLGPVVFGGITVPLVYTGTWADPYGFLTINAAEWWINVAWGAGFFFGSFLIALILLALHNIGSKKEVVTAEAEEPKVEEKPVEGEEKPAENEEKPAEEPKAEETKPAAAPVINVIVNNAAPAAVETKPAEEKPAEPKPVEEKPAEPAPVPETPKAVLNPRTGFIARPTAPKKYNGKPRAYHVTKQPTGKWQVKLAGGAKAIRVFDTQAEAIAFAKGLVESQGGSYRIHSVKGKIRK